MKKPIVAHSFEEMNKLDTELVNDIPLQKRKATWKAITELFADYEQKCGPFNAYYFSGRQVNDYSGESEPPFWCKLSHPDLRWINLRFIFRFASS